MIVTSKSQNDVTVYYNGLHYNYQVRNGYQAERILIKMMPSAAFNWLYKHGTNLVTY